MRSSTIAATCWLATFVFLTGLSATAFAEDVEADEKDTEEVSGEEVEGGEDEEFDARGTVQVDPLTAALGYWHIQVEHRLGDRVALYAGPHLRLYDSVFTDEREPYRGIGLEMGARYFFKKNAPQGLWVGARGVVARLKVHPSAGGEVGPGGYGSVLAGYTWIPVDRLVLSGGAGVQYLNYTIAGYGPKGIYPALHTALGFAF
ncbi:MAG: DUF3575 domain-containing protein [Myxococcota bacterium]|nr:DUF3575 domain-containing protein [Myxococcota bacterium]MEC9439970.1 DUF3575 domain-containing protein [Myxococcota bacterium]